MKLNLASVEYALVQLNVLSCVLYCLFYEFNADDSLSILAETEPNSARSATNVKKYCRLVDPSKVCYQLQHLLKNQRVDLEESEG